MQSDIYIEVLGTFGILGILVHRDALGYRLGMHGIGVSAFLP